MELKLPCIGGIAAYETLGRPYRANSILKFAGNAIQIELISYKLFSKTNYDVLESFVIEAGRIADVDIISKKNIVEKQKSVIGRGVAGAIVFGPVGGLIGAMSGIGSKTSTAVSAVLCIVFENQGGDGYNSFSFAIDTAQEAAAAQGFISEFRQRFPQ